eukprot:11182439-Lingulodinium_polyedra.AAC.1
MDEAFFSALGLLSVGARWKKNSRTKTKIGAFTQRQIPLSFKLLERTARAASTIAAESTNWTRHARKSAGRRARS